MDKYKILICGSTMSIGGVQKALLALVNSFDYNHYEISLLLTKTGGDYIEYINKQVKILQIPFCFKWVLLPKKSVLGSLLYLIPKPVILFYFMKNIIWGLSHHNMAQARQKMWRDVIDRIPTFKGAYDEAWDFSGQLRQFVLDKVNANRKSTWIHSDYRVLGLNKEIDGQLLSRFEQVFCVSKTCKEIFDKEFPHLSHISKIRHNLVDLNFIKLHLNDKSFDDDFNGIRLLDVTRIDPNKGLDIAVRVCSQLKKRGLQFRWYILGNDPLGYRVKLENLILEYDVSDCFILLGFTKNPFPYMNDADIIVHFSRFEGRSVAIDEALALNKTILLTNYPTAKDQIEHGVNGYICDFDEDKLINELSELILEKNKNVIISK